MKQMVRIVSPKGWMGHPKGTLVDLNGDFAEGLVQRKVAEKVDPKEEAKETKNPAPKGEVKKEVENPPKDKMVQGAEKTK